MDGNVTTLTEASFDEALADRMPLLVDFWAQGCEPCKAMEPIVADIAREHADRLRVGSVQLDDAPGLAQRFEIMTLPTLILFVDKRPATRLGGARGKTDVLAAIDEVLPRHPPIRAHEKGAHLRTTAMNHKQHHHPVFARFYARMSPSMERAGAAEHRAALLAGLTGRVIDVGAGNGLNFDYYPPEVTSVVAVEPEPHLRAIAHRRAQRAPVPIEVIDGVAENLPADDSSFDAAVVSLVLCSVTDLRQALRELRRVIRPDGQLRFFEHVRASNPGVRALQRVLDATMWPRLFGGCHTGRDIVTAIQTAGFTTHTLERFRFPAAPSPHVLGTATR
jgi:ubiquinone/menaquinone biosynthesis C-methylase UbiE/thiol-disulfide isomerase/thioredoxin